MVTARLPAVDLETAADLVEQKIAETLAGPALPRLYEMLPVADTSSTHGFVTPLRIRDAVSRPASALLDYQRRSNDLRAARRGTVVAEGTVRSDDGSLGSVRRKS